MTCSYLTRQLCDGKTSPILFLMSIPSQEKFMASFLLVEGSMCMGELGKVLIICGSEEIQLSYLPKILLSAIVHQRT